MGAVVYETGGILIDNGWLRVLGSGHDRLTRTMPRWNEGRADGFYLVADDAVGGFFAINGGALGPDAKNLYYFAPDSLEWEPLNFGYSTFLQWACAGPLEKFYEWIRWQWLRFARWFSRALPPSQSLDRPRLRPPAPLTSPPETDMARATAADSPPHR